MRKLFVFLLLLQCTLFSDYTVFAHGHVTKRSKCKTFSKRFVAEAQVAIRTVTPLCFQRSANCDGVPEWAKKKCDIDCGYQEAWIDYGGWSTYGFIKSRECSRGNSVICDLEQDLMPTMNMNPIPVTSNIETSDLHGNSIDFDEINHRIVVNDLTGFLETPVLGIAAVSRMDMVVWKPSCDGDTIITPDKIIWSGNMSLLNNKFTYRNFSPSIFSITETTVLGSITNPFISTPSLKLVTRVDVAETDVIIPIPTDINLDDVQIDIISHGGTDVEHMAPFLIGGRYSKPGIASDVITVFPNPTKDIVNIDFGNEAPDKIVIYDLSGRSHVVQILNADAKESQISINTSDLANGQYLIGIYKNNEVIKFDELLIEGK